MLMNAVCEKELEYLVLFEGDAKDYKFRDIPFPMPELLTKHEGAEITDNMRKAIGWLCRVQNHHSATMAFMGSATDMSYGDMFAGLSDASDLDLVWVQGISINGSESEGALVFRLPYSTLGHLPRGLKHRVSDKSKDTYKNERRSKHR
jgi:hypothetical protein